MTKTYFKLLEENKIKVPKTYMTLSAKAYKQLFGDRRDEVQQKLSDKK